MSVEAKVIEVVAEQLGVDKDKITRDTSFVNDLGADSLDTVELIMELEEEFDTTVENMSSLIEPIMIVFMGTMIGGLMIAMYSPIFNVGAIVG